jgi:tetratricopeptide (TPR) repeat protein
MRAPFSRSFWALSLLLPLACKDPETASSQKQQDTLQSKISEGRSHMANGQTGQALAAFRTAAALAPTEVEPLLLIAEAHRQEGKFGAAILALKQAESLEPGNDPDIQKQLAELYRRDGHGAQAIATLVALRDGKQLTDADLLTLARMQSRAQDPEGAFKTLESILRDRPDDVDAKLVEAEVLLLKGEELLAAKLMDRLIENNPGLTAARLLRARYFLNSGYADVAEKDLGGVPEADAMRPDVVTLRARVLTAQGRHAEAEAALTKAMEADPRDADVLAQLAEVKLNQGQHAEAKQLVDKALKLRPRFARALYVRGRAQEAQGQRKEAEESYRFALSTDSAFAPALSRMWRLHDQAGRGDDAVRVLEGLFLLGEASLEEKVELAERYAKDKRQLERARKIIDEVLKRDPTEPRYRAIKDAIAKATPKPKGPSGPIIMRGGR